MTPPINEKLAELCGIHLGDGCISINKRYKEYALCGDMREERGYYDNFVIPTFNKEISQPILKKSLKGKSYTKMGVYGLITFEPKIVERFLSIGFKPGSKRKHGIPSKIMKLDKIKTKCFIRGLFDTDGTIYFEKNYSMKESKHKRPKIKFSTVSNKVFRQVIEVLREMKFNPMIKKPYKGKRDKNYNYQLVLYRKRDIEKWLKEIGFKNPKHLTKVQIWKKLGYCPPGTKIKSRKKLLGVISS